MSIDRLTIEHQEKWRDWVKKIPAIQFPSDCKVQIIPPFGGAMARFRVQKNEKEVSVYLDVNDSLGYMDNVPYYEIYPNKEGDCTRYFLDETEQMIKDIMEVLCK